MGVHRNFSRVGHRQHFANRFQVADDAMQTYVHETLYPYYATTPQRKCPMLQQRSQKCASLAAIARCIAIIFTIGYLQILGNHKLRLYLPGTTCQQCYHCGSVLLTSDCCLLQHRIFTLQFKMICMLLILIPNNARRTSFNPNYSEVTYA